MKSEYGRIEFTTSFAAWAHKVLENKLLAYIETRRRSEGRNLPLPDESSPQLAIESDPLLKGRLIECLKRLAGSNRLYARILALHYQGLSKDEICERLNLTRKNSYVVMSRARAQLRDCVRSKGVIA